MPPFAILRAGTYCALHGDLAIPFELKLQEDRFRLDCWSSFAGLMALRRDLVRRGMACCSSGWQEKRWRNWNVIGLAFCGIPGEMI